MHWNPQAASNHSATLPINQRPAQERTRGPCVAGSAHLRNARKDLRLNIGTSGARKPPLGNPFVVGRDATRNEVCDNYEARFPTQPKLIAMIPDLGGRGLICGPERCHCDFLLRLANPPTSLPMRSISRGLNPRSTLHQTPIAAFRVQGHGLPRRRVAPAGQSAPPT